jgi:hypothetical protein
MIRWILFGAACAVMQAGTIQVFSSFGPGQTYGSSGYPISDSSFPISEAVPFQPSASGPLSSIDIAAVVYAQTAPTLPLNVELLNDASGVPGTTVLDSWSIAAGSVGSTPSIFSLASTLNPSLSTGTQYWVALSSSDPNGYVFMLNSTGVFGKAVNSGSGWTYQGNLTAPVLDVYESTASGTPEPATAAGLGAGLILIGYLGLRRRSGLRS